MPAKLEKDKKWKWPAEKMREWTDEELSSASNDFSERVLRLRFQYAGGQTDVLAVMQELKKGIARVKTVERERAQAAERKQSQ
jgi:large subunit ribosomal protein L29